jgi:DNA-binding transcriptional ArsR family regulator
MDVFQTQANLFKTLMHPARVAILAVLRDNEQCVCHIEAVLGFRQAYISQQLSVLREAGLVQDRREGWNIFYRVVEPRVYALLDKAAEITGAEVSAGTQEAEESCQCPRCCQVSVEILE